ncbi:MAG: hypothetical protein U0L59_06620 [Faecalimonas sp.]|nr:hypothetical protein [Faecalimonas sp.]
MVLVVSMASEITVGAADCYTAWYGTLYCSSCDDSKYDTTQTDSCAGKHPRQYGLKLCSTHINSISTQASYYKRGYSDYNCLAYALGENGVQSWTWPSNWGTTGPTEVQFIVYIIKKGYSYTLDPSEATGTDVIYVYAKNGYIQHFSRGYTLGGQKVSGAATISKWGACSLYTTTTSDPYTSSSSYGELVLTCYK